MAASVSMHEAPDKSMMANMGTFAATPAHLTYPLSISWSIANNIEMTMAFVLIMYPRVNVMWDACNCSGASKTFTIFK